MEFRILGPLEVVEGGLPVDLGAPKERMLLARLLIDANTVVSVDRLLEDLWPEGPPAGGARSLHVHVARLRATLAGSADAAIETVAPGYLLRADPEGIDAAKFERLWRDARARIGTNPRHAAATLRRALGLWRGPPLADFTYEEFADAEIRRLSELRLAATEDLGDAELALGNGPAMVGRLQKLVADHPLRERLRGQLMIALYQDGRQADALRAFRDAADVLAEELGVEPSPELRDLEERILLHDTALLASPTPSMAEDDLPIRLSSFVGRWRDGAELRRLLEQHRLVTITGVGGVGKTSLAVETARDAGHDFADGTQLVPLDGLDLGDLVADEIANAVGRRIGEERSASRGLQDYFRARQSLLLLDNCEHIIEAVASITRELLEACPELRILATSREPLGVEGETVYRLAPLEVPPIETTTVDQLRGVPAVRLFVDRAALSRHGFTLEADNKDSVAHICRRVDGIPLAIELAAARLDSMSCDELADRMDDQIAVLTGGRRTALERHQTLEAAFEVSYGLLSDADRALLRSSGVFRGGFTIEDAAAVGDGNQSEILDGMRRLVAASLVVATQQEGATRYRLLEPVRQFASERLRLEEEDHSVRRRHGMRFASKAAEITARSESGRLDRALEMGHLDRENFREALRWTIEEGQGELALALAAGLGPFWRTAGPKAEGHAWLEAALDSGADAADRLRLRALDYAIQFGIACNEAVEERLTEIERLSRRLGGTDAKAAALYLRAVSAWSRGDLVAAIRLAEESCRLAEAGGPPSRSRLLLSECLIRVGRFDESERTLTETIRWDEQQGRAPDYGLIENLGMTFYARGDLEEAERLVEEAVKGFGRRGSRSSQMEAMSYLAWITLDLGKHRRTRLLAERSLVMAREDSEVMVEANSLWVLARLALRDGDTTEARKLLGDCLDVARQRRERIVVVFALHAWADLARLEGDAERAVRLFGAADRQLRGLPHIMPRSISSSYEPVLAGLRRALGERRWNAAWAEGAALSLEGALALCEQ